MIIEIIAETGPEPLELSEMKHYLRVQSSNDDALIAGLLLAARQYAEKYMRVALVTKNIRISLSEAIEGKLELPYCPARSITEIRSYNHENVASVVDPASYYLVGNTLHVSNMPYAAAVAVDYVAGYEVVPEQIRATMKEHVAIMYKKSEGPPPAGYELYKVYRVV
jgi:uncharacterized phiE125 gp8 family phage protein